MLYLQEFSGKKLGVLFRVFVVWTFGTWILLALPVFFKVKTLVIRGVDITGVVGVLKNEDALSFGTWILLALVIRVVGANKKTGTSVNAPVELVYTSFYDAFL